MASVSMASPLLNRSPACGTCMPDSSFLRRRAGAPQPSLGRGHLRRKLLDSVRVLVLVLLTWVALTDRDRPGHHGCTGVLWRRTVPGSGHVSATGAEGPRVVLVIGSPGSGKTTQCRRIAQELGYIHLIAGDLLKAEGQREGSRFAAEITEARRTGGMVKSWIIEGVLEQAMQKNGWADSKFVIDGYPRSVEQLQSWEASLSTRVKLLGCIFLEVGQEAALRRLHNRALSSGRKDDNEETIKKRLLKDQIGTVVEHFESRGFLWRINGEGSVEHVWKDIRSLLKSMEHKVIQSGKSEGLTQGMVT